MAPRSATKALTLADPADLAAQRLVETVSDVVKFGEQQRMGVPIERCARRFKIFAPRHQRPQHGPSDENAPKEQDGELHLVMFHALQHR